MRDYHELNSLFCQRDVHLSDADRQLLSDTNRALQQLMLHGTADTLHLADALHMHHATLRRRIRAVLGMTTGEYISLERCRSVVVQLNQYPAFRIVRVAYACGFADHAHFCRFFRHYFHCSPTEYLRRKQLL